MGNVDAQSSCVPFPAVAARNHELVINDGSGRRFFAAGYVYSGSAMLSRFDEGAFVRMLDVARAHGQTVVRWNAFLKGLDLVFGSDEFVVGVKRGGLAAIRRGLDLASERGMLVQVVLATAHFLRCGWGGCEHTLMNVKNSDRVRRNHKMMTTAAGLEAYLNNVVSPLVVAVGSHASLFGFLVLNEGYFLVRPQENLFTFLADELMSLRELRRFVNRVSGRIRRQLPGVLLSASLKVKTCEQETRGGGACGARIPPLQWYADNALVAAGGDALGTLSMHQIQFYPRNAFGLSASPFRFTHASFCERHSLPADRPLLVGEFPIRGLQDIKDHPGTALGLQDSYTALWDGGFAGGFVWQADDYLDEDAMTASEKQAVDVSYQQIRARLGGPSFDWASCPPLPPSLPAPLAPRLLVPPCLSDEDEVEDDSQLAAPMVNQQDGEAEGGEAIQRRRRLAATWLSHLSASASSAQGSVLQCADALPDCPERMRSGRCDVPWYAHQCPKTCGACSEHDSEARSDPPPSIPSLPCAPKDPLHSHGSLPSTAPPGAPPVLPPPAMSAAARPPPRVPPPRVPPPRSLSAPFPDVPPSSPPLIMLSGPSRAETSTQPATLSTDLLGGISQTSPIHWLPKLPPLPRSPSEPLGKAMLGGTIQALTPQAIVSRMPASISSLSSSMHMSPWLPPSSPASATLPDTWRDVRAKPSGIVLVCGIVILLGCIQLSFLSCVRCQSPAKRRGQTSSSDVCASTRESKSSKLGRHGKKSSAVLSSSRSNASCGISTLKDSCFADRTADEPRYCRVACNKDGAEA